MSKNPQRSRKDARHGPAGVSLRPRSLRFIIPAAVVLVVAANVLIVSFARKSSSPHSDGYKPRAPGSVTFNKDIAPVVFQHCSPCHRPGQPAPFSLLSFADVRKHASDVGDVTQRRYMPPWLPQDDPGVFADERRLTGAEIGLIQQWIAEGCREGAEADKPAAPVFPEGWQFGTPDLVVQMPQAYTLPASGPDVYRNFVVPLPVDRRRFVRAMEFRAGTKVLHHVFFYFDRTQQSARRDAEDAEVGFAGMSLPTTAVSPSGHFLSWQPGRGPNVSPAGLPWPVEAGGSMLVQAHMQPSGKPEPVQPSVAFYFTDEAPTNTLLKLSLGSYAIDIPPGATNHVVEDSYTLSADARILAVLPHAHHLGKQVEAFAVLPGGGTQSLLKIGRWDFNWQSDFRYREPVSVPKGARLCMRWTYDNSTNNLRNPSHPPVRVRYGPQSSDEMSELYFQLLANTPADLAVLERDYRARIVRDIVDYNTLMLERNPSNAHAHVQLGKALIALNQKDEALLHLQRGAALDPADEEAHYHLGVLVIERDTQRAIKEFQRTIDINPDNFKARANLGVILMNMKEFDAAEAQFKAGLKSNPGDAVLLENLQVLARLRAEAR